MYQREHSRRGGAHTVISPHSTSRPDGVRSKMRPPGRPSNTTCTPGSAVTVWSTGHQLDGRCVQRSKAWLTGHWTSKAIRSGSRPDFHAHGGPSPAGAWDV